MTATLFRHLNEQGYKFSMIIIVHLLVLWICLPCIILAIDYFSVIFIQRSRTMVDKLLHTGGVPDTAIFLCNLQWKNTWLLIWEQRAEEIFKLVLFFLQISTLYCSIWIVSRQFLNWTEWLKLACSKRSDSGERCRVKKAMKSRGGLGREVRERFPLSSLLLPRFYFFALPFTSHRSPLSERLEQARLKPFSSTAQNTPCLPRVHWFVVNFSWVKQSPQEKLKTVDRFHMTLRRPYLWTKQWIGGHVCVKKSCGNCTLFTCRNVLLFQAICKAADKVTENDLFAGSTKCIMGDVKMVNARLF